MRLFKAIEPLIYSPGEAQLKDPPLESPYMVSTNIPPAATCNMFVLLSLRRLQGKLFMVEISKETKLGVSRTLYYC